MTALAVPGPGTLGRALLVLATGASLLAATPGSAVAADPPPSPPWLPAGVEALQPYVGQGGCDPVAKPGVLAFQSLLMSTYRDTGTLGIVRDCGIGGLSEHKEGRALDWAVSATNPSHVEQVRELTDWLTATSGQDVAANARRFGIMYMIWNRRIWKSYQVGAGWQPYSGANPHTGHVHFSFGWNGAYAATSWWTGRVAPFDDGPYAGSPPTPPTPAPAPRRTPLPVRAPANLRTLATYGAGTHAQGASGPAVVRLQGAVGVTADGAYGPITAAAVRSFQADERLPVDGVFAPDEWARAFPRPVDPFGAVEAGSMVQLSGWVADADSSAPLRVQATIDGVLQPAVGVASAPRPDLDDDYPGARPVGYALPVDVPAGTHTVCTVATNEGPGATGTAGCTSVAVATASTREGRWIASLYADLLGRPADPGGLDGWYGELRSGATPTREALARRLAASPEHLGALVASSYRAVLGREPDPRGYADAVQALVDGTAPDGVVVGLHASAERHARSGGRDDAWVDGLYADVLGRAPDAAGRAAWVAAAADGRPAVAAGLYASPESLERRVAVHYRALLGRDPGPGDAAWWSPLLVEQGDLALVAALAASAEYDARAQQG